MAQKPTAKKSKKEIEKEKQRKKTIIAFSIGGALLAVMIIILVIVLIAQNSSSKESSEASNTLTSTTAASSVPSVVSTEAVSKPGSEIDYPIDETMDYYTDIKVKDYGTITVKMDYKAAPITVKNFLKLADSGFYNGLTFHRIMLGFMMQGGDPLGNGTGGSDTKIYGEFSANGYDNPLSHTKGAISMARATDMNSASSQFFIVQDDRAVSSLDGKYACFGYVTSGLEYVDQICQDAQPTDSNGTIKPEEQPIIESITVRKEPKS